MARQIASPTFVYFTVILDVPTQRSRLGFRDHAWRFTRHRRTAESYRRKPRPAGI
jgi:hypothetical protein